MSDLTKMFGVILLTIVIPLAVLLAIWADLFGAFSDTLQIGIAMFGVIFAIVYIIGGNLTLLYQDLKTGRYKKKA